MNILKISCRQFAGFKDFNAEFKPGINIVFGENESGKSSLVNLLIETLFKSSQLKKTTTEDNNFIEAFFPCAVKGSSAAGNFIDGEIIFETQSGTFTLSKTWGRDNNKDAAITLITPNGYKIIGDEKIKNLLRDEFKRDDAVFREILLSPQVNNLETLNKLIRDKKTLSSSGEIINTLTQLYAEAGNNIAIENIEQGINDKINELGRNWDKLNNRPKHMGHRDAISDIYKELERTRGIIKKIKEKLNNINLLEQDLESAEEKFNKADGSALGYKERWEYFTRINFIVETFHANNNMLHNKLSNLKEKSAECGKAIKEWPVLSKNFERAKSLQSELNNLNFSEKMRRSKELKALIDELRQELATINPDEVMQDLNIAEEASNIINQCMARLKVPSLNLKVRLAPDYKIEVNDTSPKSLPIKPAVIDENILSYKLERAAAIKIPGVAGMLLSCADVNVKDEKAKWDENKNIIHGIIERYNLGDVHDMNTIRQKLNALILNHNKKRQELESYEREYKALHAETQDLMKNLNGNLDFNLNNLNSERGRDEVVRDINALCHSVNRLDEYIGWADAKIKNYEENYRSLADLEELINKLNQEIDNTQREINNLNEQVKDIKPEYLSMNINITELINENKREFEDEIRYRDAHKQKMDELKGNLNFARSDAASGKAKLPELENNFNLLQRELENKKLELGRWESILNIFNKTKEQVKSNPVDYLINKFSSYLNKISGGRLEADNLERRAQALDIKPEIYSNDKILRWLNISEGTKETIALAFRLAVINQLYQDGGAVAVFDDPLVNMDAARRTKACEIIREFAGNNQVIFLTCHEEYHEIFSGGNFIEL